MTPKPSPRRIGNTLQINIPGVGFVGSGSCTQSTMVRGTGPSGYICALGSATGAMLVQIWAKILGPNEQPPPLPPPLPSVVNGWTQGQITGNMWAFEGAEDIPNAKCNDMGTAQNQLAVLGLFSDQTWILAPPRYFCGLCAMNTDCPGDTGSGSVSGPAFGLAQAAVPTQAVETAPRQWGVMGARSTGQLHVLFQQSWVLSLQPGASDRCLWGNGGDGVQSPQVELSCDGPLASVWQLSFRQGADTVTYTMPAAEWQALNVNVFTALSAEDGLHSLCPAAVSVAPM